MPQAVVYATLCHEAGEGGDLLEARSACSLIVQIGERQSIPYLLVHKLAGGLNNPTSKAGGGPQAIPRQDCNVGGLHCSVSETILALLVRSTNTTPARMTLLQYQGSPLLMCTSVI